MKLMLEQARRPESGPLVSSYSVFLLSPLFMRSAQRWGFDLEDKVDQERVKPTALLEVGAILEGHFL